MTSPAVSIENLSLTLGAFALRHINFTLDAGEVGVILGPNGAGKSVTLETIAGFHRPSTGRIVIQGRDVTELPPERRRLGFIFQNFGLFPHLSVEENIAFGLHAHHMAGTRHGPSPQASEVRRLMGRFGLESLAQRGPAGLSPGEKQRVALARSLATHPDVFLLDEPFSALDPRTSETLREELRRFLRDAGIPAIFVTHDHLDALILADKIAVMQAGEIVQTGPPSQVFAKPATRFVAEFLGIENILRGSVVAQASEGCRLEVYGKVLCAPPADGALGLGRSVCLCIHAEDVRITTAVGGSAAASAGCAGQLNRLTGPIVSLANVGPLAKIIQDCGFPLVAYVMSRTVRELGLRPGLEVIAEIDGGTIHLIEDAGA